MEQVGVVRRALAYPQSMHAVVEGMLDFLRKGDPRLVKLLGGRTLMRELRGLLEWSRERGEGRVPFMLFWGLYASPVDAFARAVREQEMARPGPHRLQRREEHEDWERYVRFRMTEMRAAPYSPRNARQLIDALAEVMSSALDRPSLRRDRPFAPGLLNEAMNRLQEQRHGKDNDQGKVDAWREDLMQAARSLLTEAERAACRLNEAQAEEYAGKARALVADAGRKRGRAEEARRELEERAKRRREEEDL